MSPKASLLVFQVIMRVSVLLTLPLWFCGTSSAVTVDPEGAEELRRAGFENLCIKKSNDSLFATIENRAIRGSYRMIGEALWSLARNNPEVRHFRLAVGENAMSQLAVEAQRQDGLWEIKVNYDVDAVERNMADTKVRYSSFGKIDVTLHPIVSIDNHILDKLARVGIYLAPSIETTLWRGNRFIVQPIIPIFTNIPSRDPESQFQWGVVGLRQTWWSNRRFAWTSTLGSFLYDLAGLNNDVAFHVNRRLDLGLHLGLTTRVRRNNGAWEHDRKWHVGAMAVADYYEPITSLQLKFSAGTFAYGDFGARFDVVRHFGEYAVGAYAIYTDGERNAGFNFAIPLGRKRQRAWPSNAVRLRLPHYFSWEYSMLNYYRYAFEHMGVTYKEIPDKSFTTHYWQAAYTEHYLKRFLEGKIK